MPPSLLQRIIGQKLLLACLALGAQGLPAGAASEADRDARTSPAAQALLALGARYQYGGRSPQTGFDCSGLVLHVYAEAWGLHLPRNAREQSAVGMRVRPTELQPGDLVFYNTRNRAFSHVGIYIGEGHFVHAPRPGARVRVESIDAPYWRVRFNGARRVEPPTT